MKKFSSVGLLWLGLYVAACTPKDPQPAVNQTDLYAISASDSLITLPTAVDFTRVSQQGKGPVGRAIRLTYTGLPVSMKSYTYDETGKLTGIYEPLSYGYDSYQLGDYQGSQLQRTYLGYGAYKGNPSDATIVGVTLYRYNADQQLILALQYNRVTEEPTKGKLNQVHEFHYTPAGQLVTSRLTYKNGDRNEATWEKGNIIKEERTWVTSPTNRKDIVTYVYDQHTNIWAPNGSLTFPAYNAGTVNNTLSYTIQSCMGANCFTAGEYTMERRITYNQQGYIDRAEFRHVYSSTPSQSSWMGYSYTYPSAGK